MRRRRDYDLLGSLEDEDNDGGEGVPFARSYVFSSFEAGPAVKTVVR